MAAAAAISSQTFLKGKKSFSGFALGSSSSDLHGLSSPFTAQTSLRRLPNPSRRLEVKAIGNIFGNFFQIATFGESHGGGVGCTISGCPPNLPLCETDIQIELNRRRPGQSRITTPRKETDTCKILSGIYEGMTIGTPIDIYVPNTDQRGHIIAYVSQVFDVALPDGLIDYETVTADQVESNIVRCPDPDYAQKMIDVIDAVRVRGDSVGGVVTFIARNVPPGLGLPYFYNLEADLAKAMLSIPASKGFEFESEYEGALGSGLDDELNTDEIWEIQTRTNYSGGIQEGLSNGETICMTVYFKPTSTIGKKQRTVTRNHEETELIARGRHDPCVLPRAVPVVEAMGAIVLVDHLMAKSAL